MVCLLWRRVAQNDPVPQPRRSLAAKTLPAPINRLDHTQARNRGIEGKRLVLERIVIDLESLMVGQALKLHRSADSGEVSNVTCSVQSSERHDLCGRRPKWPLIYLVLGGPYLSAQRRCEGAPRRAVASDSAGPPRGSIPGIGRGGARNRANRQSHALTPQQVAGLTKAASHADRIGSPLNRMISIHWQAAGLAPNAMAGATGQFLGLLAKAMKRHRSRFAAIWVRENGADKGDHCHILAHIPASLVKIVTRLQLGWLKSITKRPYKANVIRSVSIGGKLGLETGNPAVYAHNLKAALGYILKGANPEAAEAFDLARLEPGGLIVGKRCGFTQNLGPGARRQAKGKIMLR